MIPFIDLKAQQAVIRERIDLAVARVLEHGQYIMGPEVRELEAALSAFCDGSTCLTCANGTDALVLALRALGVGPGDAVFVPSFTFVATAESVLLVGATPVFVDVRADSFNMCAESLAEAVDATHASGTLSAKAVIPVDLFGQPADYPAIRAVADMFDLKIIADAAQSFGGRLQDTPVGRLADVTTTSFFPAKPLGCYGDGGAVLTEDDELAQLILSMRNHGQGEDRYDNVRIGTNSRLDTIQAAVLLEKLKIFSGELEAREIVAARYHEAFADRFQTQTVIEGARSAWAQYTLVAEDRDAVRERLAAQEVPTAVYYPRPNHVQAPYREAPIAPNGLTVTEWLMQRVFSVPMHPYLTRDVQDRIIEETIAAASAPALSAG